jgi:hypothetical protein
MPGKSLLSFQSVLSGILLAALAVAGVAHAQDSTKRGRKYKSPPPTARFEVTVVRATNGKPVENASVIFHPLENGRDNGNMELKTNDDGKAVIELLEIGTSVRVQIIAPGFQTYGEDYKVDKDSIAVAVKLKRPAGQYSIYKNNEGKPPATDKTQDPPKDAPPAPEAQKDTPKDAPKQDPASPNSTNPDSAPPK